jgi:hypothetical protein
MKTTAFLFFVLVLFAGAKAQEIEINGNGEYTMPIFKGPFSHNSAYRSSGNLVYIIDTVQLPFIDDFSTNKQKKYWAVPTGSNIIDSIGIRFLADGVAIDTIKYMYDTTYTYLFNGSGYDTLPNNAIELIRFDDFNNLNEPTDTQTVWPACEWRIEATGTIKYDLSPDSVAVNTAVLKFVIDDNSLWLDSRTSVYINDGMGIEPPTIGVATFDGLDHNGFPYDIAASNVQGRADTITSKPINLDLLPIDSVYLSFYFQSAGNGNVPESNDSLALDFFNVITGKWDYAWSTPGIPSSAFSQVKIPITNTEYLQAGFQFRFRNYATLSGGWDVWNIDYVHLDKNRSLSNNSILDVAFENPIYSYVNNYSAVPWDHYKTDPSTLTIGQIDPSVYNFSGALVAANSYYYEVFDEANASIYNSDLLQTIPGGVPAFTSKSEPLDVATDFTFPIGNGPTEFSILTSYDHSGDINKENDTLRNRQIFDTYYSYDDGSAETAYFLVGVGAKGAQKFSITTPDTLKGVNFYFPTFLEDASNRIFNINIYTSLNPEVLVYSTLGVTTTTLRNEMIRFAIEDTDLVMSGTFYIGWEQASGDEIYIGMDLNTNNQDNIFYNAGNVWNNTSYTGSLFIRPDFGEPTIQTSITPPIKNDVLTVQPKVFPNPAKDLIRVKDVNSKVHYKIHDINGKVLDQGILNLNQQIDIQNYIPGFYIINIIDEQNAYSLKFIKK